MNGTFLLYDEFFVTPFPERQISAFAFNFVGTLGSKFSTEGVWESRKTPSADVFLGAECSVIQALDDI